MTPHPAATAYAGTIVEPVRTRAKTWPDESPSNRLYCLLRSSQGMSRSEILHALADMPGEEVDRTLAHLRTYHYVRQSLRTDDARGNSRYRYHVDVHCQAYPSRYDTWRDRTDDDLANAALVEIYDCISGLDDDVLAESLGVTVHRLRWSLKLAVATGQLLARHLPDLREGVWRYQIPDVAAADPAASYGGTDAEADAPAAARTEHAHGEQFCVGVFSDGRLVITGSDGARLTLQADDARRLREYLAVPAASWSAT
jgi:hypothetical protein